MGAWIEIKLIVWVGILISVAPLVGAWIEIVFVYVVSGGFIVAPLVGAWIEIRSCIVGLYTIKSLLSWERGLKCTHP